MNLKLIFGLSLYGIAIATSSLFFDISNFEWILHFSMLFFSAFMISRFVEETYFLHGFLTGFIAATDITIIRNSLVDHYSWTGHDYSFVGQLILTAFLTGAASGLLISLLARIFSRKKPVSVAPTPEAMNNNAREHRMEHYDLTLPLLSLPESNLIISIHGINLVTPSFNQHIPISEIQNLVFKNGGYDGETYVSSYGTSIAPSFYSGRNNYLTFMWKEQECKFVMYVGMEAQQDYLFRWIKYCNAKGMNASTVTETQQMLPSSKESGGLSLGTILTICRVAVFFVVIWLNKNSDNKNNDPSANKVIEQVDPTADFRFSSAKILSLGIDTNNNFVVSISIPDSLKNANVEYYELVEFLHRDSTLWSQLSKADSSHKDAKLIFNICSGGDEKKIIKSYP